MLAVPQTPSFSQVWLPQWLSSATRALPRLVVLAVAFGGTGSIGATLARQLRNCGNVGRLIPDLVLAVNLGCSAVKYVFHGVAINITSSACMRHQAAPHSMCCGCADRPVQMCLQIAVIVLTQTGRAHPMGSDQKQSDGPDIFKLR